MLPEIELITDGLMGLVEGSDDAMQSLTDGLVGLIEKVATAMPTILDTAGDLLLNLIVGLADVLSNPEVINSLVDVIETLLFKAVEILPTLTQSLLDIAVAVINGLLNLDWGTLILNLIDVLMEILLIQLPTAVNNVIISVLDKLINLFTTKEGLQSLANFGKALAEGLINGLITGIESGVNGVIKIVNEVLGGISKAWTWAGIPEIPDIPTISIPKVKFAKGGMFDDVGTTFLATTGEAGAEIVHTGSRGTGVANVEQIAEAQFMAMEWYDLRGAIRDAVVAIVNGLRTNMDGGEQNTNVTVQIGDREFKSYIVNIVNETLRTRGRQSLNDVTSW